MPSNRISHWRESLRAWWAFSSEMQRDHIKIGAVICIVLILAGGGYIWSRPQLRRWEQKQALEQAKDFAAQKDYRSALLALQRAMEKDANDVSAWKQVAAFLSELGSREVLVARKNLVALEPKDMSLRLGFVLDALRFGDVDAAKNAFGAVRVGAREEVDFFRMAAAIAYVTGQTTELENSLMQVVARAPDDHQAALDLATLRLWGADAARSDAAKQTMLSLLHHPEVRARTAVELLKHVVRTGDREEARATVAVLHREFIGRAAPHPVATDDGMVEPPGWVAVVEAIKRAGLDSPQDAAVVARWLGTIGQAREALVWLDSAPEKIRRALVVSAAALELAVATNDVERLRPLLLEGAWGNARGDTIDLAFAARWQRQMGRPANAQATWGDAVTGAAGSLPNLRVLTRLAMAWDDNEGGRVAMLAVVDRFASERWAWESLKLDYLRHQETAKLWQLYDKWSRAQPDNRVVAQDWVMLSLLSDQISPSVHLRARELYQSAPSEAPAALGYAASLRAQKKRTDALVVLDKLPAVEQNVTRVVLWRGVLLAETDRKATARAMLATLDASQLMPEEIQLWKDAMALTAPQPPPKPKPAKSATASKS